MELRFAEDILLLANSGPEAPHPLEKLTVAIGSAGLILKGDKTGICPNKHSHQQRLW